MAWVRITIDAKITDASALEKAGRSAAHDHGFDDEAWAAYREKRGNACADVMEWIPQPPAGVVFEKVSCVPSEAAN